MRRTRQEIHPPADNDDFSFFFLVFTLKLVKSKLPLNCVYLYICLIYFIYLFTYSVHLFTFLLSKPSIYSLILFTLLSLVCQVECTSAPLFTNPLIYLQPLLIYCTTFIYIFINLFTNNTYLLSLLFNSNFTTTTYLLSYTVQRFVYIFINFIYKQYVFIVTII